MLKGISRILSPELFYVLMSMGHGDEIVFGDANIILKKGVVRL